VYAVALNNSNNDITVSNNVYRASTNAANVQIGLLGVGQTNNDMVVSNNLASLVNAATNPIASNIQAQGTASTNFSMTVSNSVWGTNNQLTTTFSNNVVRVGGVVIAHASPVGVTATSETPFYDDFVTNLFQKNGDSISVEYNGIMSGTYTTADPTLAFYVGGSQVFQRLQTQSFKHSGSQVAQSYAYKVTSTISRITSTNVFVVTEWDFDGGTTSTNLGGVSFSSLSGSQYPPVMQYSLVGISNTVEMKFTGWLQNEASYASGGLTNYAAKYRYDPAP